MKPRLRMDRWRLQLRRGATVKLLGIERFDKCEASKFALRAIVVAMMVFVARANLAIRNPIDMPYVSDHLDRKAQPRYPVTTGRLVFQIRARGSRVFNVGLT